MATINPEALLAAAAQLTALSEAGTRLVAAHDAYVKAHTDYEAIRDVAIEALTASGVNNAFDLPSADTLVRP